MNNINKSKSYFITYMDFLIGILLVIITIILLYNFATISISSTQFSESCNTKDISVINQNSNNSLSKKNNINSSNNIVKYDYNNYFYL